MPSFTGTSTAETINGSAGDDVIDGLEGDDQLFGLEGSDTFIYRTRYGQPFDNGDGSDLVDGGAGDDILQVDGDVLGYRWLAPNPIQPSVFSLTAGSGGDALFEIRQEASGAANPDFFQRLLTLRGVERIVLDFTFDTIPTAPHGTDFWVGEVLTIGDLSGTGLTGTIEYHGGGGADVLDARNAVNRIVAFGGGGDDTLRGGAADDVLDGGEGLDVVAGGAGSNILTGSIFATVDYSGATQGVHADLNEGRAVNNGFGFEDTLNGFSHLIGSAFNDVLIGDAGVNRLTGGAGSDYLIGLAGDDTLAGGTGAANTLQGGSGDDTYLVEAIGDTVLEFAGEGFDRVYTSLASLTLRDNVEFLLYTGAGAFTGRGAAGTNHIYGGALVDHLHGGAGDDLLHGGSGSDQLYGGAGNDQLDGGASTSDTANYSLAAAGVHVNLSSRTARDGEGGVDTMISIEAATGSAFDDVLIGDGEVNTLNGGLGRDVLVGFDGNDVLIGGTGAANQMQGGLGSDTYRSMAIGDSLIEYAGEGYDVVEVWVQTYTLKDHFEGLTFKGAGAFTGRGNSAANGIGGGASADALYGLGGNDSLSGDGGNDTLVGGDGDDGLFGGAGDDTLLSDAGNDRLVGDDGEDTLTGAAGNDDLSGGDGNDTLLGGEGDDILVGGHEEDILKGGAGNDQLRGDWDHDGPNEQGPVDIADYSDAGIGLTLRVAGSNADGLGGTDTLIDMEGLIGTAFDDLLIGDWHSNTLSGGTGRDTLLGYDGQDLLIGGAGAANTLQGGAGSDTYVVSVAGDSVIEFANEGLDTVQTTLSAYSLRAHVENLEFKGIGAFAGTGNAAANDLTGSAGDDVFTGLGGNDHIRGGDGVDTVVMSGVRSDYVIAPGFFATTFTISDNVAGRDGLDTLQAVERIRFSDGTVLDLTAPAALESASVMERLERAPDGQAGTDDFALSLPDPWSPWNDF